MRRCKECIYYAPCFAPGTGGGGVITLMHGECRLHPPVSTVLKDSEGLWEHSTDWPIVVEGDWCGEFKHGGQS